MKTTLTSQTEKITSFIALFRDGVKAWIKAGELLVEMTEENPEVYDDILKQCPTSIGRTPRCGRRCTR